jgi:hypothetical protein
MPVTLSRAWSRIALSAAFVAIAATPSAALDIKEIETADDKTITILLSGTVVAGDGLKVRSIVGKLAGTKPITAQLAFAGGVRTEAFSIGRFLHQIRVRTVIPAKATCISPCPLVLVAGRSPDPKQASSIKYSSAILGFSAAEPNFQDKAYSVADLDRTMAGIQRDILQIADYLTEIGANISMLKFYQSALKPKEVRYITNEQALDLGIAVILDETGELIAPLKQQP